MTWLVKVALDRPYTFIVMALMILIFGPLAAIRTPTGGLRSSCKRTGSCRLKINGPPTVVR